MKNIDSVNKKFIIFKEYFKLTNSFRILKFFYNKSQFGVKEWRHSDLFAKTAITTTI